MTGFDILKARRAARINQSDLVKALSLSGRGTLVDIEHGEVDVTPEWATKAINTINELAEAKAQKDAA